MLVSSAAKTQRQSLVVQANNFLLHLCPLFAFLLMCREGNDKKQTDGSSGYSMFFHNHNNVAIRLFGTSGRTLSAYSLCHLSQVKGQPIVKTAHILLWAGANLAS